MNIISIYTSLIYTHFNRDTTGRITRAGCGNYQVKSVNHLAACYFLVWWAAVGTDVGDGDGRVIGWVGEGVSVNGRVPSLCNQPLVWVVKQYLLTDIWDVSKMPRG